MLKTEQVRCLLNGTWVTQTVVNVVCRDRVNANPNPPYEVPARISSNDISQITERLSADLLDLGYAISISPGVIQIDAYLLKFIDVAMERLGGANCTYKPQVIPGRDDFGIMHVENGPLIELSLAERDLTRRFPKLSVGHYATSSPKGKAPAPASDK